jgi:hypothetical protein
MRCASRAGRIERVKLAEVSSCCVVSGGFPCLRKLELLALRHQSIDNIGFLLYEIRKGQGMERQTRKPRNIMVGDCPGMQPMQSFSGEERSSRYRWATCSDDMRLND